MHCVKCNVVGHPGLCAKCFRELEASERTDYINLLNAHEEFTRACWQRMVKKLVMDNYRGWDDEECLDDMIESLKAKIDVPDMKTAIDVANLAMFIGRLKDG